MEILSPLWRRGTLTLEGLAQGPTVDNKAEWQVKPG